MNTQMTTSNFELIGLFCMFGVVLGISFASACITWLYTFCIGDPQKGEISKGRILSRFGYWLMYNYNKVEEAEERKFNNKFRDMKQLALSPEEFKRKETMILRSRSLNKWKALGCCPVCSGVWIALISHTVAFAVFSLNWWLFIPSVAQSSYFVRKWLYA